MTRLFGRQARVRLTPKESGAVDLFSPADSSGYRIEFEAKRTKSSREPDSCAITVWGLGPRSRGAVERSAKGGVVLEGGHRGTIGEIFKGTVARGWNEKTTEGWASHIETEDGGRQLRDRVPPKSYGPDTPVERVFKDIWDFFHRNRRSAAISLYERAKKALNESSGATGFLKAFIGGFALEGRMDELLDKLSGAAGLDWTVRGEELIFVKRGGVIGPPIEISAPRGMVGSPSMVHDESRPKVQLVKVTTMISPDVVPLREIRLISRGIRGRYRAIDVTHKGDTHGQEWYTEAVLEAIG